MIFRRYPNACPGFEMSLTDRDILPSIGASQEKS
jgi:hypothetical protein